MEIDSIYKDLRSGKCCLLLGSLASTQDMGIYNGWYCTKYYRKGKYLTMKVSEQCGIAASKGN